MNARDKELAKQAELMHKYNYAYSKELKEFTDLIRADEREACAKMCDVRALEYSGFTEEQNASEKLAEAIRARGNT